MHQFTPEVEALANEVLAYSLQRLKSDPPLDGPRTAEDLFKEVGNTITEKGLGGHQALEVFTEVLAKACISTDHPRNLAFIPSAPSEYANLFDLVVGASALYGGSWQEGSGAVFAENQASEESHSSLASAAKVMDVELLKIKPNERGCLTGDLVEKALTEFHEDKAKRVFVIVATAGTTNLGIIDDLLSLGNVAKKNNIWFHVDGAYGLAALCAPSVKEKFKGVELADSLIVDPHKWLFAPFDACALIYRNPALAKEVHTQHASYLETLHDDSWSPSDYAINLTRRTRGLPFWFSLAAHGTNAYAQAMEQTMTVATAAAERIRNHPNLELICEPELSIVAFERIGWKKADYLKWSEKLLADQIGFIPPSSHKGKPILRFAIVNPWTKIEDIDIILETL